MSLTATALIVLIFSAVVVTVAIVWLAVVTVRAMRSLDALTSELREKGMPLVEKADVMVDAANVELLRIDAAITRFEEASVRVGAATGTLSDIVQAPAGIVNDVAGRVRRAWKERKSSPPGPQPSESQDVTATPSDQDDLHDRNDVEPSEM